MFRLWLVAPRGAVSTGCYRHIGWLLCCCILNGDPFTVLMRLSNPLKPCAIESCHVKVLTWHDIKHKACVSAHRQDLNVLKICTLHAGALADPMCGSGTFLIEAALMATNTAPGLYRKRWPFQSWPDFDQSAWDSSVASARQAQRKWDGVLLGNDVHEGALRLAKR